MKFEDIGPGMRVKHSAGSGFTAVVLSKSHATFRVHFDVDPPSWDTLYDSGEASNFERLDLPCEPITEDEWIKHPNFPGKKFPESEPIEQEARRLVHGDRDQSYDNPRGNFGRIANIWEGILDIRVSEEQVALCMAGVKIARLAHDPQNHDSKVDLIGYALCLDWLGEDE